MTTDGKVVRHTPGPWQVGLRRYFGTYNANMVYAVYPETSVAQIYGIPLNCTVEELQRSANGSHAEGMANAALIAAAPEMLEALEGALTVLEVANIGGRSQYAAPFTVRLRKLIRKAKGE